MKQITLIVVVTIGVLVLVALYAAFGGLILYLLWQLFNLSAIVALSYWQAVGVYWIFLLPTSVLSVNINLLRNQLKK